MNGTQAQEAKVAHPQTTHHEQAQASIEDQGPTPADPPLMAGANGSSSLTKKRKKEALKPIITTEGPAPTV